MHRYEWALNILARYSLICWYNYKMSEQLLGFGFLICHLTFDTNGRL